MEIIVNDTNIFIDLYSCGLLDSFFELPYKVHTTDFVISELKDREQREAVLKFCAKEQLTIKSFTSKELVAIWEYYNKSNKVCKRLHRGLLRSDIYENNGKCKAVDRRQDIKDKSRRRRDFGLWCAVYLRQTCGTWSHNSERSRISPMRIG